MNHYYHPEGHSPYGAYPQQDERLWFGRPFFRPFGFGPFFRPFGFGPFFGPFGFGFGFPFFPFWI